jgi:hypothetical protein
MRGRTEIVKAWLNLNGIATTDGTHPTGRRVSVLRTKVLGLASILAGLATAYFFIVRPIIEANGTGVLHQSPFGLVMPITLHYVGIAMLAADLRDAKTMRAGAEGKLFWTRKGKYLSICLVGRNRADAHRLVHLRALGWPQSLLE